MWLTIAVAAGGAIAVSAAGGLLTTIGPWYRGLRKPSWQPPDWAFGPAWTTILGMAAASGVLAWNAAPDEAARLRILVLFADNAFFHVLWTPLFFTWRRPDWALVEVVFLWFSILALIIGLAPMSVLASWLLAPYILWVTFAGWLNRAIVELNGPFSRVGSNATGLPRP